MFAGENKGKFPPAGISISGDNYPPDIWDATSTVTNKFDDVLAVPAGRSIYPEYLTDVNIWFCPSRDNVNPSDYVGPSGWGFYSGPTGARGVSPANGGKLDPVRFDDDLSYAYYGYVARTYDEYMTMQIAADFNAYHRGPNGGAAVNLWTRSQKVDNDFSWTQWGASSEAEIRSRIKNRIEVYRTVNCFYWPVGSNVSIADPVNLTITGTGGGTTIFRVKEGIERFMITDINNPAGGAKAQSNVAAMWDRLVYQAGNADYTSRFNHIPGGNNVLYMDGHVSFVKFPQNTFPITRTQALFGRF